MTINELTDGQIDALPAGREMDTLVAEALGGRVERYGMLFRYWAPGNEHWDRLPHYSDDIADAWPLAIALSKGPGGEHFQVTVCEQPERADHGAAFCARYGSGHRQIVSFAETELPEEAAPLAICRTFLKAKRRAQQSSEESE